MQIVVDAMGGDRAPRTVVNGVGLFLAEWAKARPDTSLELVLIGDEPAILPLLRKFLKVQKKSQVKIRVVHAPETIGMEDSPIHAVRQKKDSSIVRGLEMVADAPENSGFLSAGHSGAVFAAALFKLGRLKNIERPAIATILPTIDGHSILVDAGANTECRGSHLVDFALMGAEYAKAYLKKTDPVVGVLANGEEDSKGTELTREALSLLRADASVKLHGHVEGKEIFKGKVDVVVTDGFTGNVVLKSLEGLGSTLTGILTAELKRHWYTNLFGLVALPALRRAKMKFDYAEVGSAPLLGVGGNCFIGHGRSGPKAIKNGIFRVVEALESGLYPKLEARFGGKS